MKITRVAVGDRLPWVTSDPARRPEIVLGAVDLYTEGGGLIHALAVSDQTDGVCYAVYWDRDNAVFARYAISTIEPVRGTVGVAITPKAR